MPGFCNSVSGGGFFDTPPRWRWRCQWRWWADNQANYPNVQTAKVKHGHVLRVERIFKKNYMTASLTVRQQASGQAKRENNEINRWARLADTIYRPPTTVSAVARQLLAAPQRWCRPSWVVHIHVTGEAGSAGEKHRHLREGRLCLPRRCYT